MALQEEPGNWSCFNGIVDAGESDLDCGGSCSTKCGYNQKCSSNEDCAAEYSCVEHVCSSTGGRLRYRVTRSKADATDFRYHARFNRLCHGNNRQCALRGAEGHREGVPRGKLWCIRCLSQTGHSILLQAKHSLVAILIRHALLCAAYTLELGADVLANTSLLSLTTTDNTAVHGARHAVLLLDVQLGESVLYA